MIRMRTVLSYGLLAFLMACVPVDDRGDRMKSTRIDRAGRGVDVQNLQRALYAYGRDSILSALASEDKTAHYLALRRAMSVPDSQLIAPLAAHLQSTTPEIARLAAFALGQQASAESLSPLLQRFSTQDSLTGTDPLFSYLLEAAGKSADPSSINLIASAPNYTTEHTALLYGQMLAIYRALLRGVQTESAIELAVSYVDKKYPPELRLVAAHILARARDIDLRPYETTLYGYALSTDTSVEMRRALAKAFKHIQDDFGWQTLNDWLDKENNEHVRVDILRSMMRFSGRDMHAVLRDRLTDKSLHVQRTAAEGLMSHTSAAEALPLRRRARSLEAPWQVKAPVYAAAHRHLSNSYRITKDNLNQEIMDRYLASESSYEKAAYARSLCYAAQNLEFLKDQYSDRLPAPVRTEIIQTLSDLLKSDAGRSVFTAGLTAPRKVLVDLWKQAFGAGHQGPIAIAAGTISEDPKLWKRYIGSTDWLLTGLQKLDLPRELESYLALEEALDTLEIKYEKISRDSLQGYRPLEWSFVAELRDTIPIRIETNRGTIVCELYTRIAPGSVVNFLQLAESDFYDGKYFHRVVPSFVIQAGCPIGDGYGSLDYTIRSEYSELRYDRPGILGMASAGRDTEGTQWFITHAATPHLDGRYTIFGAVTDGMKTVHEIRPGDQILSVDIL